MNDAAKLFELGDEDIFSFDVADAALEAAAGTMTKGAAMSMPNAPTVSILIVCCGNDEAAQA